MRINYLTVPHYLHTHISHLERHIFSFSLSLFSLAKLSGTAYTYIYMRCILTPNTLQGHMVSLEILVFLLFSLYISFYQKLFSMALYRGIFAHLLCQGFYPTVMNEIKRGECASMKPAGCFLFRYKVQVEKYLCPPICFMRFFIKKFYFSNKNIFSPF